MKPARAPRHRQPAVLPRRTAGAVAVQAALLALGLAATLPAIGLATAQAAEPAAAVQAYDIPAGPLDAALARFGQRSGVLLSYPPELTAGRSSPGLGGAHAIPDALARLLAGSGLEAVPQANGGYTLRLLPAQRDATLAPVTVKAGALRDATSEGTGSYAARGTTLFKGTQSLKEIPQSVTVITRQRMDDQRLDTLTDLLENTTGITIVKRPAGGHDIYSRGFIAPNLQYDGVPVTRGVSSGNSSIASTTWLDRVEVLRGAQGLLEGAGNPGGAVNLVRKRGLAETAFNVEGRLGSWDNYGTRLDAGGSIDEQGRLRARAVIDFEDKKSFLDAITDRNLNLYGALDFDLTPDTTLGLGLIHSRVDGNAALHHGVPRYANGEPLDISRSTNIGADWNDNNHRKNQLFLDLEHRLNADWTLKVSGNYMIEDWDALVSYANGRVPVGGTTVAGSGYAYAYQTTSQGLDANLSGRFNGLGIEHEIVVGGNFSNVDTDNRYVQYFNYMSYDVFNPDHDAPRLGSTSPTSQLASDSRTRQKGLYGVLRSHLTDRLTLALGARSSWYDYRDNTQTTTWSSASKMRERGETTPFAGLVFALTPQWSAYASYADIFQPQTATNAQRQVLQPIVGSNYEAGVKGELFDGALNVSLAHFRIDQKNRAVTDTSAPMVCGSAGTSACSRAAGEVRSEGWELEAHGQLSSNWQISGGYTYNRNKFLQDNNAALIGTRFDYNTPKHILRLWSDWRLPGGLNPWRVGAGVQYQSAQETNSPTSIRNPLQGGYSVWNARVAYQIDKRWSAALNIENLFDKRYYAFIDNYWYYGSYVGAPRNFTLTVRGSF
ncbi:TonB-dependent siderophore receptor [Pseudothauera nasutitermitis]|uniref:TonB-dependent siderophore receptor n=1 Tax=Pseudothauera nasutitermitis TaxID=2565930 RepID=A0A4V3WCG5_9RHOO|nr:TonB-dependent siderophore receptor [Pseudothauera nasutitermitis]THF67044.1 TonB-dependent siderophore receptor [Pseudothauera nasutitermitis]